MSEKIPKTSHSSSFFATFNALYNHFRRLSFSYSLKAIHPITIPTAIPTIPTIIINAKNIFIFPTPNKSAIEQIALELQIINIALNNFQLCFPIVIPSLKILMDRNEHYNVTNMYYYHCAMPDLPKPQKHFRPTKIPDSMTIYYTRVHIENT